MHEDDTASSLADFDILVFCMAYVAQAAVRTEYAQHGTVVTSIPAMR
jgi:hypothetical protein